MKLPNGYGSVTKLRGKRRKPFRVRVYVVINKEKKRKLLGDFSTREEAFEGLVKYNENPYDLSKKEPTFRDVFKLREGSTHLSHNTKRNYISKYKNYCSSLYDLEYSSLTLNHFRKVVEDSGATISVKNVIMKFLKALGRTALEHDIVNKNYTIPQNLY